MLQKIVTILYLSGDPLPINTVASILKISVEEIENNIPFLKSSLESIGLTLLHNEKEIAIVTKPEESALVETFWKDELQGDLTPAALQVLTLVAYLGNGTREQISYIRGVQSAQSVRSLTVRGLITRNGEVCTLTMEALKHLGVTKQEELPEYVSIHAQLIEKLEQRTV
ncbi:MAG: SMC-Scp complex subunit ScpB [Candidatus Pacebacteria bacterium]|nr:SMC-Scp complex subunit ScpB [Candidatus Paceibacterota bacterium]MBP9867176.1 SMC-Scp complex subunit ScpB [Candidatus Paceibacterota bacterium]